MFVQVLNGERPVPGALISIQFYQAATDKGGHAFFELYEGEYEVRIAITKGATPITGKIAVWERKPADTAKVSPSGVVRPHKH